MRNEKTLKTIFPLIGGFTGVILGAIAGWHVSPETGATQMIFAIVGAVFGLTIGYVLGMAIFKTFMKKNK